MPGRLVARGFHGNFLTSQAQSTGACNCAIWSYRERQFISRSHGSTARKTDGNRSASPADVDHADECGALLGSREKKVFAGDFRVQRKTHLGGRGKDAA